MPGCWIMLWHTLYESQLVNVDPSPCRQPGSEPLSFLFHCNWCLFKIQHFASIEYMLREPLTRMAIPCWSVSQAGSKESGPATLAHHCDCLLRATGFWYYLLLLSPSTNKVFSLHLSADQLENTLWLYPYQETDHVCLVSPHSVHVM